MKFWVVQLGLAALLGIGFFDRAVAANLSKGRFFDRAIIVIFENTDYAVAYKQPFFRRLATEGANFTNFIAETHPSQGNYVALTSGALASVRGDGRYNLDLTNITDLLEARSLNWKVYAEGYPGNCFLGASNGLYVRKHNPFVSYINVQSNSARCAKIVNAAEFDADLANGALPDYVFYIPDLNNDGHDTGAAFADKWYQAKFGPLISNSAAMANTVLISTFDESGGGKKNLVYTSIFGPAVRGGDFSDSVSHYSILRMLEDNWSLGTLGRNDETAQTIPNIWK